MFEDEKYVVLNKRSRIAIQGDFGSIARIGWDQTLIGKPAQMDALYGRGLIAHILCRLAALDLRAREGCEELSPVHRLDKATTGV